MARDSSEWLVDLGLGEHADAFAESEIDFDTVLWVSEEDRRARARP